MVLGAACMALTAAADSHARTWRVARDGSGDFAVISDAVNAASSGDVISIGPGEYPETPTQPYPIGVVPGVAWVTQDHLTFVGDGRDLVVVGPVEPAPENRELAPYGIVGSSSTSLSVSGISFRNLSSAVEGGQSATIEVSNSRFTGGWVGVSTIGSGWLTVRDCIFIDYQDAAVMVFSMFDPHGALVERCEFYRCGLGIDFQPDNCAVLDSTFDGQGWGSVGVQVSFGGEALIERCTFAAHDNYGVVATGGSRVFLYECVFGPDMPANVSVEGLLVGDRNHLAGGTYATLMFTKLSMVDFHGNHILNGGGYSVRASSGPEPVKRFDLSGNYWGTTNAAQLDEWICDHHDRPTEWFAIVDYLPLADQPIPTDESSIGRLKAKFSGD